VLKILFLVHVDLYNSACNNNNNNNNR